jgi:hypothetical protein
MKKSINIVRFAALALTVAAALAFGHAQAGTTGGGVTGHHCIFVCG